MSALSPFVGASTSRYFEAYGRYEVHKRMLLDSVRVDSYMKAINDNASIFRGCKVLDVGSGTGLLAMLVAKHTDATMVYAIEANNTVAELSREIVADNGLSDRVTIFEGTVEELIKQDSSIPMVDIIISEWMGHYLLHESMLDSVLRARDKWLQTSPSGKWFSSLRIPRDWSSSTHGGLLFPLEAEIKGTFFDAVEILYEREDWARDLRRFHGLNLSRVEALRDHDQEELILAHLSSQPTLTEKFEIVEFNLANLRTQSLDSISCEQLVKIQSSTPTGWARGLVLWFDCKFPSMSSEVVVLSTAPGQDPTHWKQSIVLLPDDGIPTIPEAILELHITLRRECSDDRRYNIDVEIPSIHAPLDQENAISSSVEVSG